MNDRDRILPRFWSIRDKEYIYWDCYMQTAFNRLIEPNTYGLMYKLYKDRVNYIPEMPTGLRDKNGKLIYEGDIVKAFGFKDYYKLVCRFRDSSFCLDHIDGSPYNFAHSISPVEVIGNIHENADLIKVGGK